MIMMMKNVKNVDDEEKKEMKKESTLRVCRGVSFTAVSISAKASLVRRRFSGRGSSGAPRRSCLSFDLMLSSDQSDRIARISRGPPALIEPLAQMGNVLHCPVNATTHCKSDTQVSDQKNNSKTV